MRLILGSGMNDLPTILRRVFLVVGLIFVAILVCKPTGAGEVGMTFPITRSFYTGNHLSENDSSHISPSNGTKLEIPLTGSLSLDLSLTSVDTPQALTGAEPFSAHPIPVVKPGDLGLGSFRLGAGFEFRF
jgi:hypothetical protein